MMQAKHHDHVSICSAWHVVLVKSSRASQHGSRESATAGSEMHEPLASDLFQSASTSDFGQLRVFAVNGPLNLVSNFQQM